MSENRDSNMDEIREIIKRLSENQEFILNQQSKHDLKSARMRDKHGADMAEIHASMKFILSQQEFILEQQSKHDTDMEQFRESMKQIRDTVTDLITAQAELRNDVDRLVNIVENTRDFAQQVAQLAVASEKRLTILENRFS